MTVRAKVRTKRKHRSSSPAGLTALVRLQLCAWMFVAFVVLFVAATSVAPAAGRPTREESASKENEKKDKKPEGKGGESKAGEKAGEAAKKNAPEGAKKNAPEGAKKSTPEGAKKGAAEAPEDKSPIALTGGVSEDSAGPKGLIRFWMTIENRSPAEITNVRLRHPEIPGFRLKRLCWPDSADNHCDDISAEINDGAAEPAMQLSAFHKIGDALAPGQSLTVWGYLESENSAPKQSAFVTLTWRSGENVSSKTVALGDVESLPLWRAWVLVFIHGWEWSFPLLSVFGLFLYHQLGGWAKGKSKARENEHEHARRTWNMMLPRAQQIALRHYTPLVARAFGLRDALSEFQKDGGVENLASACYELLAFQRRLINTVEEVGGYYFKNRDAENLADPLYLKHRHLMGFNEGAARALYSAAVNRVKLELTYAEFSAEKDRANSPLQLFWLEYQSYMLSLAPKDNVALEKDIYILDAYGAMLNYEANRPSLYWYGTQNAIDLKYPGSRLAFLDWKEWTNVALLNIDEEQAKRLEARARIYLKEAEEELVVDRDDRTLLQKTWEGVAALFVSE